MSGLIAGATLVGASLGGVGAGTAPMTADWQPCLEDATSAECTIDQAEDLIGSNGQTVYQGGEMARDAIKARRVAPVADDGLRFAKPVIGGVAAAAGVGATTAAVANHQKKKMQNRAS
jgi:hypothetical protein